VKTGSIPSWAKISPYDRYFWFISPKINRYAMLLEHIERLKLNPMVIEVEGNRHIFIIPPGHKSLRETNSFPFKGESPYLFAAHYDRVPNSPGANDNSIAVFHLLNVALLFIKEKIDNWMIVFTDKEEIREGESFEDQGSFSLGKKLVSWGLEKVKIYNFDVCGAGDTFIISTTTDHILKDGETENIKKVRNSIHNLRNHALATADHLRLEKVLLAPTPFSDDVGFLRAGLAAQTITMLPSAEAAEFEAHLRNESNFADLIISGKIKDPRQYRHLPETWRNLNNENDTPSRLTPQYFEQIVNFMTALARL